MMTPPPRAACLTPPALGGIAVVQVVGAAAPVILTAHLRRGGGPMDPARLRPDELRLCRLVDGDTVLDDVVVCTRPGRLGEPVVDLNLHGGARIVQRVLLMLRNEGVEVVDPRALLDEAWPADTRLHSDAFRMLPRAATRRVALWLARLPDLLAAKTRDLICAIVAGDLLAARRGLEQFLAGEAPARRLLDGVRVVLVGPPNSGKSTLANALAQRDHAIVSDVPGTTRDWTEHPTAIDGVPFTIVDTAGLRETEDAIEREAIARTHRQSADADLVVRVVDRSQPRPDPSLAETSALALVVHNKSDLACHPDHRDAPGSVSLSARDGRGVDALRAALLERVGLPVGAAWPIAPVDPWETAVFRTAGQALDAGDAPAAAELLGSLIRAANPAGRAGSALV